VTRPRGRTPWWPKGRAAKIASQWHGRLAAMSHSRAPSSWCARGVDAGRAWWWYSASAPLPQYARELAPACSLLPCSQVGSAKQQRINGDARARRLWRVYCIPWRALTADQSRAWCRDALQLSPGFLHDYPRPPDSAISGSAASSAGTRSTILPPTLKRPLCSPGGVLVSCQFVGEPGVDSETRTGLGADGSGTRHRRQLQARARWPFLVQGRVRGVAGRACG
jgi:hypothetical protein